VLDHIAPFNHLSAFGEDDTDDVNEGDF